MILAKKGGSEPIGSTYKKKDAGLGRSSQRENYSMGKRWYQNVMNVPSLRAFRKRLDATYEGCCS